MTKQDAGNRTFGGQGQQAHARGLQLPTDNVAVTDSTKYRTTDRDQT
jgi:hypothetical protein